MSPDIEVAETGWKRRGRLLAAATLIAPFVIGVVAAAPAAAAGNTYYVDASAGSDSSNGTSPTSAWRSLAKLNATTFVPGDRILLHAGQSWAGQLHPLGSGSQGSPITLSNYGTGAKPLIDGSSLASGGTVYLQNQAYWTIDGLQVTSNSGTNNFGTASAAGHVRQGILVDNESNGLIGGITISNDYVHDVNGCFNCSEYDAHANGGIIVMADPYSFLGINGGSSYNGVSIVNNTIDHVGRTGIMFWDYSSGNITTFDPNAASQNITISGNHVTNTDSDGIELWGGLNNLMEHNVVGNAGQKTIAGSTEPSSAGLWPVHSENTTVQYNEVYGTLTQGNVDGQGFDDDVNAINTVFQYNYSHDNQGGFMLMEGNQQTNSLTVRYNLSVNDGWGGTKGVFTFAVNVVPGTAIYDNTVYIPSGSPAKPFYCDGFTPSASTPAFTFKNNIVANFGTGDYEGPNGTGTVIDHNLFWGVHPASEPADAHKLTSDPQFVGVPTSAPTGIGSVTGFQVQSTSPAAGSGVLVANNGGKDYFGRTVSSTAPPTRGFHEVQNF